MLQGRPKQRYKNIYKISTRNIFTHKDCETLCHMESDPVFSTKSFEKEMKIKFEDINAERLFCRTKVF